MTSSGTDLKPAGLKAVARRIVLPDATGRSLAGYDSVRCAVRQNGLLEANLVALEDGAGVRVIIISLDVLFAGAPLVTALRAAVGDAFAIIAASHTHFAPATDPSKPRLGDFDEAWTTEVAGLVAATAQEMLRGQFAPVTLSCGQMPVPVAVNRRRRVFWPHRALTASGRRELAWFRTGMAPNPKGPADSMLRLCSLTGAEGQLVAQIWNWACHPTSEPDFSAASADYVGDVRSALRLRPAAVEALPVIHLQGFCGDIRPPGGKHRRWMGWRRLPWLLRSLLIPAFHAMTPDERMRWGQDIAAGAMAAADKARALDAGGPIRAAQADLPLAAFLDDAPERAMTCSLVRIGNAITLAAMACEPSTELGPIIRDAIGQTDIDADRHPWLAGYVDDSFGYLPADAQVPHGGYEVSGYMTKFSMTGRYARSIDGAVAAVFRKLAAELG